MTWGNNLPGVHFLLSLVEPGDAAVVRRRLGIGKPERHVYSRAAQELQRLGAPRSVWLWVLEEDEPRTRGLVFHHSGTPDALKNDILRGRPFGRGETWLPMAEHCVDAFCSHETREIPVGPNGMIGELRAARTMGTARIAVRSVTSEDWAEVAAADEAEPLPGYARWALTERIDCPARVRTQFGSHPKFAHRLRQAGIVELVQYVETTRPPHAVLGVLHFGRLLFPRRLEEAVAVLSPLVRSELGADPDAWAVLAQLLPTFAGTVPELVRTSGAIAHAGR
ncbi:hypothetical protein ACFWN2_12835 [Lentzea sp. NPDC058436]|uniref:hypothetical protein n=1 Tax=Lentzea sp. NPDC058436 TaxID=3346499 RepID=UPI003668E08F